MVSTVTLNGKASCHKYVFVLVFLLHDASLDVRASRSLISTAVTGAGASSRIRSLQEDIVINAAVKPSKMLQEDPSTSPNWQQFSQKLLTRQMGSKPPNCVDKCGICRPCEAVEVPVSNSEVQKVEEAYSSQQHVQAALPGPGDTNYMPESWRCACGDEYYNP